MEDLQQPWTVTASSAITYALAGFHLFAASWLFILAARPGAVGAFIWYLDDSWLFGAAILELLIGGLLILLVGRLGKREYYSWLALVIAAGWSAAFSLAEFPAGLFGFALSLAVMIMLLTGRTRSWIGTSSRAA